MKVTSSAPSTGSARSNRPPAVPPPFDFTPLNRVLFGAGTLARLGEVARELGGSAFSWSPIRGWRRRAIRKGQ